MQTWIALLRGINVGGRNKVSMQTLRSVLESVGCRRVRTYIQSGNVVFDSPSKSKRSLSKRLGDAIESHFGFRPNILVLTPADFRSAIQSNPFLDAQAEPKTLHFYFLESVPKSSELDTLSDLATETERFQLVDTVFYLHAPDGIGRSKLASGVERKLGVAATARNYQTILALSAMLTSDESTDKQ